MSLQPEPPPASTKAPAPAGHWEQEHPPARHFHGATKLPGHREHRRGRLSAQLTTWGTQDGTDVPDPAAKVCLCFTLGDHWVKREKQARG